jgi:hypothetical protein
MAPIILQLLQEPIIVRIIEPPDDPIGDIRNVLVSALGISGVITVAALLMGVIVGGLMFWLRSRSRS